MRAATLVCTAGFALAGLPASAGQITSSMLGPSETMVSICAGLSNGTGFGPGGMIGLVPGRFECQSASTTVPGQTVARSAAWDELPLAVQSSAAGQARMGELQLQSWMKGDNIHGLSAGSANAGWNDRLTLTPLNPALNGQIAYFEFLVRVTGTMTVTNTANASTGISLIALRDDGFFGGAWAEKAFGVFGGPATTRTIDQVGKLWVGAPLGTPFELGLFAVASSSGGSSLPGPNEASADFVVTWQGISQVSLNGTPVAYSLTSQSGIDWSQAVTTPVPEPGSALLMLAGAGGLVLMRRRRPVAPWARAAA